MPTVCHSRPESMSSSSIEWRSGGIGRRSFMITNHFMKVRDSVRRLLMSIRRGGSRTSVLSAPNLQGDFTMNWECPSRSSNPCLLPSVDVALFPSFLIMFKYEGYCLRKGSRSVRVIRHIFPSIESHRAPSGWRRGFYACEIGWKIKYIATHNVSRYVTSYGYIMELDCSCEALLHAHHSLKHQENCTEKWFWLWSWIKSLIK